MNMEQMDMMEPRRIPAGCTIKEYRRSYASAELYKKLNQLAIIGYVLCGINVVLSFMLNIFGLFEAAFLAAMLFGMSKKRIKGCAIAILVYMCVGVVLSLIGGGGLTGWAWIILGINALSIFKKIDGEYKEITAGTTAA